ncbi:MAG: sigma-54-dependent Fis family transcriptional regulator [Bacteroidetes bacterium HGW-Bacteroidetes-17]|jgi:DNA-binding NtrC family response regulator|nr:MAG: sigma-54-dependent Fis family transcriptional regulator [Bacteroidetes bacterium HGW-Bacteroidetes-17]
MNKYEGNILIIDDDPDVLDSAKMFLDEYFTRIEIIQSPRQIHEILKKQAIDVVLLDMNFQKGANDGKEGKYWLSYIQELCPETVIILMTAFGDISLAVEVMKLGAFDFIQKPWNNSKLLATVSAAHKHRKSRTELSKSRATNKALNEDIGRKHIEMIGKSAPMLRLKEVISKIAPTDANVLILGENGSGKDLIAREIHRCSQRKNENFIRVDLASLPESLFESEIFGHIPGAFTDAKTEKAGRFELASGGTIFLDELANLSLNLQSKLLTVLQNREIYRLGSSKPIPVDIRLICATNQSLLKLVEEGKFRQDLYYRLNTFEITIPPLRDRKEDIPELIHYFLNNYCKKYRKTVPHISGETINKLKQLNWAGNVRELQNAVERACILSENKNLEFQDFFVQDVEPSDLNADITNLDELEKRTILKVLKNNGGNLSKSAQELGIHRNALYRRLEKYGL